MYTCASHVSRKYTAQIEDPETLSAWIEGIQNDRYFNVREQRDQYHSMQEHYMQQMGEVNGSVTSLTEEKESLVSEKLSLEKVRFPLSSLLLQRSQIMIQ